MRPRWIELDGTVNTRDLGGLATLDGGSVRPGRLIRSDNLGALSERDVDLLTGHHGVQDVVDLRTHDELTKEGPGRLRADQGVRYHHHSLIGARGFPRIAQAAKRLGTPRFSDQFWSSHYVSYLDGRPEGVRAALAAIAGSDGAAIVHCAAGKDRTGTVVALALSVAGVVDEEIIEDYLATGERVEAILNRLNDRPAYAQSLAEQAVADQMPRREAMEAVLGYLRERGGAGQWLIDGGWSPGDVAALRARLID